MATEETIIRVMPLPEGVDWQWHADLNVIAVSDRLDEDGRTNALLDLQAQWRRKMIRVVPAPRTARITRPIPAPYSFQHNGADLPHTGFLG